MNPQPSKDQPAMGSCISCGRTEEADCEAPMYPGKPIPWGWSWALGSMYCERCSTSAKPDE